MNAQQTTQLLRQLAAQEVPANLDLWPHIHDQIKKHPLLNHADGGRSPGGGAAKLHTPWRPLLVVGLMSLCLAIGIPLSLRAAPEAIRQQFQRFGVILVESTPMAASVMTAPSTLPASQPTSWISVEEAQRQVSFPIRVPTWLPAGLMLRGALVGTSGAVNDERKTATVILSYGASDGTPRGLHIDQIPGAGAGGIAIPANQMQHVLVNGQAAVYAHGAWQKDGRWDPAADAGTLSWDDEEITYVIQFSGLGLTSDDLVRIAESLR
jgi:hypothetical protein